MHCIVTLFDQEKKKVHSRGEVTQKRASQKERLFFIDCIPYIGRLGRAFQFILFSRVGILFENKCFVDLSARRR